MSSQLKNMFSRCTVPVCCVLIVVGVAALRPGELLFTAWVPVYKPRRLSMGGAKVFRGWYGTTLGHVMVFRLRPKLTRSVRVGRRPSGAMHIHTVTKLCCMLLGLASAPGTRRQAHATSDTVPWERRIDGMAGKQLKALLPLNSLKTSGNKTEQLRRVVDHIIRGAPRSCTVCGKGRICWNREASSWRCAGFWDYGETQQCPEPVQAGVATDAWTWGNMVPPPASSTSAHSTEVGAASSSSSAGPSVSGGASSRVPVFWQQGQLRGRPGELQVDAPQHSARAKAPPAKKARWSALNPRWTDFWGFEF